MSLESRYPETCIYLPIRQTIEGKITFKKIVHNRSDRLVVDLYLIGLVVVGVVIPETLVAVQDVHLYKINQ